jgi:hypothetical protein
VGFVHRPFAHLTSEVAMDEERAAAIAARGEQIKQTALNFCGSVAASATATGQAARRPRCRSPTATAPAQSHRAHSNANDHASNSYLSARHRPRHKRHATAAADHGAAKWDSVHLALHHAGADPDLAARSSRLQREQRLPSGGDPPVERRGQTSDQPKKLNVKIASLY